MYEFINKNGELSSSSAKVVVIDKYGKVKEVSVGGGGAPSGPAGGDLSGTYPNPSVVWNNGTSTYNLLYYPLSSNPAGYLTTAVTSVGMTVPSAFNVTPSTITSTGTFAVTGAGLVSQYIRGDGSLATFPTIPTGTVTSVAALTLGTTGTDLTSTVADGTTTPVITLNVPTASATNRGALSTTDWTTFNNKQNDLETFNRTQGIYYFEEFMGNQGGGVSTSFGSVISSQSGAGANSTNISGTTILNRTNQQGVNRAQTGTTAAGSAGFAYSNQGLFRGTGAITLETYITIETLSTSLERFYNYFGYLGIGSAVSPNNGIFFLYDEGGLLGFGASAPSPNWKCVTINTSVRTFTITSIPVVAGQWYKLRIVVNAAGNSIQFFIDGTLVATHTTNIPANTLGLNVGSYIVKAVGLTARAMQTDYFMYKEIFTNPR